MMDQDIGLGREAVLQQLEKIVSSQTFERSQRARELLGYLVRQTLDGNEAQLKAFSIAQDVFGRDESFDAENDTLVRVQAGRLRTLLSAYYRDDGQDDAIEVSLPKGGYVPVFKTRASGGGAGTDRTRVGRGHDGWREKWLTGRCLFVGGATFAVVAALCFLFSQAFPLGFFYKPPAEATRSELENIARLPAGSHIAVLPVAEAGGDSEQYRDSLGLTYQLTHDLTRFPSLFVISTQHTLQPNGEPLDIEELKRDANVAYLLSARVKRDGDTLRVTAQLSDVSDMKVLWSQVYEKSFTNDTLETVFEQISAKVAAVVGAPYGIIRQTEASKLRGNLSDELAMYQCVLRFFEYAANKSEDRHREERRCLETVTEVLPEEPEPWAMLSWIYGDEIRYGFNAGPQEDAIEKSLDAAKRAYELAPLDAFAHQYLAEALFLADEDEMAMDHLERALVLNPNDTEVLASVAWQYAYRGDWELAEKFAFKAKKLNPFHPNWYRVVPYLAHLRRGEYQKALEEVEVRRAPNSPLAEIGRLVARAKLGRYDEARALLDELDQKFPGYSKNVRPELRRMRLPDEFIVVVESTITDLRGAEVSG